MNSRVLNALKKVAADTDVPSNYTFDRIAAWGHAPGEAGYPGPIVYNTDMLPPRRAGQAADVASKTLELVPGSDAYNRAVQFLIRRGQDNWHNFKNPTNPRPVTPAPNIKTDAGKEIPAKDLEALGRMIVNNKRPGFGGVGRIG